MVTLKFSIINICLDKNSQQGRKIKDVFFDKMTVDRKLKVPNLILSTLFLSERDIGLKHLF